MPYADPAKKLERDRAYKAARRADLAAKQRAYYKRTRPARDAYTAEWARAHPEINRIIKFANTSNNRARNTGRPERLYASELKFLTGPCCYCGGTQETWDHAVPVCRGGPNLIANLVPSCLRCNRIKSHRTAAEFRQGRSFPRRLLGAA